jgi:dihydroneopterin aldolase
MSDLIRIVDLEVYAHIGVSDAERARAQKLFISLDMTVESFGPAAAADDVALTVNYFDVAERIKTLTAQKRPHKLLETLAEKIARDLLHVFPIQKLTLEIKKLALPAARHVSVKIERRHGD